MGNEKIDECHYWEKQQKAERVKKHDRILLLYDYFSNSFLLWSVSARASTMSASYQMPA